MHLLFKCSYVRFFRTFRSGKIPDFLINFPVVDIDRLESSAGLTGPNHQVAVTIPVILDLN